MRDGTNMTDGERLWFAMIDAGLVKYGALIEESFVREVLGIEVPETGSFKTFQRLSLIELNAVDYVREQLLGMGMCMPKHDGMYRIPLPSENSVVVANWVESAARKLRRADKLRRGTQAAQPSEADQTAARILMQQEAVAAARKHSSSIS
jgi:hypothetical protein